MRIFISYRRDDSAVHARLLHRELSAYFGAEAVFMDFEDIGWGEQFAQRIDAELARADVVVVVVGPRWAGIVQQRLRGDDWVRHEVEQALRARAAGRLRVLPVLVGGARWQGERLPRGLSELPLLNAPTLRDGSFDQDVVALVEAIRRRRLWADLLALAHARRARLAALGLGLAAAIGAWTGVLDLLGLDTRLNTATMAAAGLLGPPPPRSADLVLVAIDEDALRAVGRPFDAHWRSEHALVVDRAREAGARSLAFDLFLDAPGDPAADAALAGALARARGQLPVILAAHAPDGTGEAPDILPAFRARAAWGVGCAGRRLGHAYAMPLALARAADAPARPSLALAAFVGGAALAPVQAQDRVRRRLRVRVAADRPDVDVNYFGARTLSTTQPDCALAAAGDWVAEQLVDPALLVRPFLRVAYADVLRGDPVALSALRDRIVLVGTLLPDRDRLPVTGGPPRWGLQLIAAQIDSLLQGRAVRSPGPGFQAGLGIALGLAGAGLAVALHGRPGRWLAAMVAAAGLAFGAAVLGWYRVEGQLIGVHYGWVALVAGAWAARRIMRSSL